MPGWTRHRHGLSDRILSPETIAGGSMTCAPPQSLVPPFAHSRNARGIAMQHAQTSAAVDWRTGHGVRGPRKAVCTAIQKSKQTHLEHPRSVTVHRQHGPWRVYDHPPWARARRPPARNVRISFNVIPRADIPCAIAGRHISAPMVRPARPGYIYSNFVLFLLCYQLVERAE